MEKIGKEKRDILVQRIKDGRKDQAEAKEQFQSTLEAFQALTGFSGGDLEEVYKKLNSEYEKAAGRAKDVHNRIQSIEKVSTDMFNEWDKEIESMRDAALKSSSRRMRRDTEKRYDLLIARMKDTESKMDPVLAAFHDKVLFLKHNLNARAISSLKKTSLELDKNVASLVKDIESSITEADAFIAAMEKEPAAE
jgi:hypothetical protein